MRGIDSSLLGIQCSSMDKINYYNISREELKIVDSMAVKPSILLHVCCGPCSCFPLTDVCPHFKVTIYYNNSNIYPKAEFDKRLGELKKVIQHMKDDHGYDIKLIVPPYDNDEYNKDLEPYKDMPEGQLRCFICYEKRMDEAYKYAEDNGYDYFATIMTVSKQKNSQVLNSIGEKLSKKYPKTKYFFSDFKKKDGNLIGNRIADEYKLYKQLYCGCKYTYEDGLRREKERQEKLEHEIH